MLQSKSKLFSVGHAVRIFGYPHGCPRADADAARMRMDFSNFFESCGWYTVLPFKFCLRLTYKKRIHVPERLKETQLTYRDLRKRIKWTFHVSTPFVDCINDLKRHFLRTHCGLTLKIWDFLADADSLRTDERSEKRPIRTRIRMRIGKRRNSSACPTLQVWQLRYSTFKFVSQTWNL